MTLKKLMEKYTSRELMEKLFSGPDTRRNQQSRYGDEFVERLDFIKNSEHFDRFCSLPNVNRNLFVGEEYIAKKVVNRFYREIAK